MVKLEESKKVKPNTTMTYQELKKNIRLLVKKANMVFDIDYSTRKKEEVLKRQYLVKYIADKFGDYFIHIHQLYELLSEIMPLHRTTFIHTHSVVEDLMIYPDYAEGYEDFVIRLKDNTKDYEYLFLKRKKRYILENIQELESEKEHLLSRLKIITNKLEKYD